MAQHPLAECLATANQVVTYSSSLFHLENEIKKKIRSLHTQYSSERQKIRTNKSGDGTDNLYKTKWPYFDRLKFLNDHITARATQSNLEVSNLKYIIAMIGKYNQTGFKKLAVKIN